MKLEHGFTVAVPVQQAWDVLLDVPTVAPCMPGASLTSYEGDEFTGTVKVKLGPINLTYQGKGRIVERAEADRRAVIEASGKESRGAGTAKATVTAVLRPDGDSGTRVDVTTDLNITGRPAQFGRGMMVDVGNKLIGQFADCLSGKLAAGEVTAGPPAAESPAAGQAPSKEAPAARVAAPVADADRGEPEVEPIDLLQVTGAGDVAKRVAKYAVVFALGLLLGWVISRWAGD